MRIPRRALLAFLSLTTACHAFAPSIHTRYATPFFSMVKESSEKETHVNSHALNLELDSLAQRCSDPSQPVILLASQCEDMYKESDQVDLVSFNTVLKAWSKTCSTLADKSYVPTASSGELPSVPVYTARDAVERATQLLLDMEQDSTIVPDASSYNVVIDAWAKSRIDDAPQACERLLKRMLESDTVDPDTISYNGVLDAWAQCKTRKGMDRVLRIYHHMQDNPNVQPTMRTVNTIITAYAKLCRVLKGEDAMESARAAHALLEEMKERYEETGDPNHQVDIMTYTSVIDAYGRCANLEATKCAESLLKELHEQYEKTGNIRLQPNYRTYTSLIVAWSKTRNHKSPHRAEELLKEMQQRYEERMADPRPFAAGEETTKPNTRSYTSVIQAWARSRDPTKPQRALRLLKEMKQKAKEGDDDVRPNLITYNAAIDACARCQGNPKQQMEALKITFALLKSLEMELEPNQVTFATVLKATAFLLPAGDERNKVAMALFEKAKAAGMVDLDILKNMRKTVDNNVMNEIQADLQDRKGQIDYNKIPPSWSRNVRY